MKNLFNKYCDFIGIENEGNKRLLLVFNSVCSSILFFWFIEETRPRDWGLPRGDIFEIIGIILPLITSILISTLFCGLIIKTFNWVKDGYKNKEDVS